MPRSARVSYRFTGTAVAWLRAMKPARTVRHGAIAALIFGTASPALATSIDASTSVYVEPATIVVVEGNGDASPNQVVLTVNLGYGDTARPQSVEYEIFPGTAMPGEDYEPVPPGSLVFQVGEQSKTITVSITGDRQPECSEYFFLRLSRGGVVVLNRLATIRDDDADAVDGGVAPSCDPRDGGSGVEDAPPDLSGSVPPEAPLDAASAPVTSRPSIDAGARVPRKPTEPRSISSSGCSITGGPGSPWMPAGLVGTILGIGIARRVRRRAG